MLSAVIIVSDRNVVTVSHCFKSLYLMLKMSKVLLIIYSCFLCSVPLGLHITARQLREFALPGAIHPVDCPGCEHGVVPVGRRVWRNICHHVAWGLLCYRGTRKWLL